MGSDQPVQSRPSLAAIKQGIAHSALSEISYPRLELKSEWNTKHGKSISAIANHESLAGGWVIIGVDDRGKLIGKDKDWAKKNYATIGDQINQHLSPSQAVKEAYVESFAAGYCILLEIQNPAYVTDWLGRAYKRAGSSDEEMTAGERAALAMHLPGDDYSSLPWQGEVNSALVLDFGKKVIDNGSKDFPKDMSQLSSSQILRIMRLDRKMAAGILFGDVPVRIAHYDANGQPASNITEKGLYTILRDSFIVHIQTASERKGATSEGNSIALKEWLPYPTKLLREILANAVAHTLYQRHHGEIIVDIHPDRVMVRNNAPLEAEIFASQWFSQRTMAKNKLLMEVLRTAGITDELGTGKAHVFRLAIEAGKEEPTIDFFKHKDYAQWSITVYNAHRHEHIENLMSKLNDSALPSPLHRMVAVALVLWKDSKWSEIKTRLDEHYSKIANEVIKHEDTPVISIDDNLFVLRWADTALRGQSSKGFTPSEEDMIKRMLMNFADTTTRQITTQEARQLIGLGKSPSESVQLSNLFRKWQKAGLVQMVKRGTWQFQS
ncbi:MAG: putative DNA binding domain-containing protein [Pseudomonadota bacterium]|nr:putative DNA binding domain-containing protein [Pseudomonadota bacterium]